MNNINVKETLLQLGYKLVDRGPYWQTNALFRGGDNKTAIQIYKDSGVWKDYVNQTPFMPFNKLVQATLGSNDEDFIEKSIVQNTLFSSAISKPIAPRIKMEKTYDISCLDRLLPHFDFYEKKGISSDIIKKFKGGLSTEGKMYQRFVFPVFNLNKKIHGFSGRDMNPSDNRPKWKHIGTKTKWIFPWNLSEKSILDSKELILVESIGDILSLYQNNIENTLCCFGTQVSPSLISYIVKVNPQNILISLNNDSKSSTNAGLIGSIKSFFSLISLVDYNKVKIVLPVKNDFGDMDKHDYEQWLTKKENAIKDFDYKKIIDVAEKICAKTSQPKTFHEKIKKFKKQIYNE